MIVFRLCHKQFAYDLSGKGAEQVGGRWNSKGIPMLYTGESRALCTTEIAVHTPLGILPVDRVLVTYQIPDSIRIEELKPADLPRNWRQFPYASATSQIGDAFIKAGKNLILKVPSAVVPGDFNYLINPLHKDLSKVKIKDIVPFEFDARLFAR